MTWNSPCLNEGCTEAARKRGMCNRHYNQWRREHGLTTCTTDGCDKPVHGRGLCVNHYMKVKAYWKTKSRATKLITCLLCGRESTVRSDRNTKYCSMSCAVLNRPQGYNKKPRTVILYDGPKFRRDPKPNVNPVPKSKRIFKSVQCKICDTYFVTLFTDLTCSSECQSLNDRQSKAVCRSRRRSRKRRAFVEDVSPRYIFNRDGYRCNLRLSTNCSGKTDPDKVVPHLRAPTVDHIIPLNAGVENGGVHSRANAWTACFECNCIKSDGGGGEQLALIG